MREHGDRKTVKAMVNQALCAKTGLSIDGMISAARHIVLTPHTALATAEKELQLLWDDLGQLVSPRAQRDMAGVSRHMVGLPPIARN